MEVTLPDSCSESSALSAYGWGMEWHDYRANFILLSFSPSLSTVTLLLVPWVPGHSPVTYPLSANKHGHRALDLGLGIPVAWGMASLALRHSTRHQERKVSLLQEKQNQNTIVLFKKVIHPGGLGWKGESRYRMRNTVWWLFLVLNCQHLVSLPNSFCLFFSPSYQVCLSVYTSNRTQYLPLWQKPKGPDPPLSPNCSLAWACDPPPHPSQVDFLSWAWTWQVLKDGRDTTMVAARNQALPVACQPLWFLIPRPLQF